MVYSDGVQCQIVWLSPHLERIEKFNRRMDKWLPQELPTDHSDNGLSRSSCASQSHDA